MMNGVMVSLSCLQVIFHKHVLQSGQSADVPDTTIDSRHIIFSPYKATVN